MHPRLRDLLACLLMIALVLACFGRLAARPGALIVDGDRPSIDNAIVGDPRPVGNDLTFLFLPHFEHVAAAVARHGRLPMWDDSGFAGRPMVGNPQGGLFYPPVWLAWAWRSPAALGWLTVAHLIWAGIGVYALGRVRGCSRLAATVAGGGFAASPFLLAQTFEGHYPHVWAACWFPWAFWAYFESNNGRYRGTWALPLVLACAFLTGHPQEWYYLTFALGLWAVIDAGLALKRGDRRAAVARLVVWGAVVGLSLGLIAIELLPDMAAQAGTLRSGGLTFGQVNKYNPHSVNLLQLLSPTALGGPADYLGHENYWEALLSIGLVPLMLAALAVLVHPERGRVRAWLALAVVALVFAGGRRLALFSVLYQFVPGMNRFRVPSRSLFLVGLAGAMLAGHGIDALRRSTLPDADWAAFGRRFRLLSVAIVAALLIGQALSWATEPVEAVPPVRVTSQDKVKDRAMAKAKDKVRETSSQTRPRTKLARVRDRKLPSNALTVAEEPEPLRGLTALARIVQEPMFWVAVGGSIVAVVLAGRGPSQRRAAAWACGALALCELGWHGHHLIQVTPAERFVGSDPISAALANAEPPVAGPFRIRARDTLYGDLAALLHGFEKININDWYQLQRSADLYQTLYPLFDPATPSPPDDPMLGATRHFGDTIRQGALDRLSIAFLVTDGGALEVPCPRVATGTWRDRPFAIHRNPTALPRAYVVPRAYSALDSGPRALALFQLTDPRATVLMVRDPLAADGPRQPFTPAEWVGDDPDHVIIRVATAAPGLLVVADTWATGWEARVDGRPAKVLRGNHAQRVVALEQPGPHVIEMSYKPPGFVAGFLLTGISLVVWTVSLVTALRLRARTRRATAAGAICHTPHSRLKPRPGRDFRRAELKPSRDASATTIPG